MSDPSAPAAASTGPTQQGALAISAPQLLAHWQGHRQLTRRLIERFPEEELFSLTIGGMRTFGEMVLEMLSMAVPTVRGVATGDWEYSGDRSPRPRADLLRAWDEDTARMDELWPQIPAARFQEVVTAFGQWTMPAHGILLYVIDNEIHHRGQGYVYLRALGVEPPPFHERS